MMARSFLVLLGVGILCEQSARAEPLVIDQTAVRADARRDAGTGLCGTAVHYRPLAMPLSMLSQAAALLDKPATDPGIQGRAAYRVERVNLKNAIAGSEGDFTAPSFPDRSLPFSSDASAMPVGDDINIAVRLRGYLNVHDTRGGLPVTFALHCGDACSLSIGGQAVIAQAGSPASARVTRQVVFQARGLYPIEVLYYQNSGPAHLELARALSAEPEGDQSNPLDPGRFQPIPTTDLYSALIGENTTCKECAGTDKDCAAGSYCGSGLCQNCNLAAHCGASCQTCPTAAPSCSFGQCVECTADDQCPAGKICNRNKCGAPIVCKSPADCPTGQVCGDRDGCGTRTCGPSVQGCTLDAMCPAGFICRNGYCRPPVCPSPPEPPTSGGCAAPNSGAAESRGVALSAMASLLLCALMLRHRRRTG